MSLINIGLSELALSINVGEDPEVNGRGSFRINANEVCQG